MKSRQPNLPHAPFSCIYCYALLTPPEQRIADIVKRLVAGAPDGATWVQPQRVAICEREGERA